MSFKEKYIECATVCGAGAARIYVREWGEPSFPVVLAVHGLGGQGSNFDLLAQRLCREFRVICPDMPGRGKSSRAGEPEAEYCFSSYLTTIEDLLAKLEVNGDFDWIGTSMGGALGQYALASSLGPRIRRLVANDVGYRVDAGVLEEIRRAVGTPPHFQSLEEAAEYFREFLGGISGREQDTGHWREMAERGCRPGDKGGFELHYDPEIAQQIKYHISDFDNRESFARLAIPMMVIWGMKSTVLTADIVEEMSASNNPFFHLVKYETWGHAPFLEEQEDYALIRGFLKDGVQE